MNQPIRRVDPLGRSASLTDDTANRARSLDPVGGSAWPIARAVLHPGGSVWPIARGPPVLARGPGGGGADHRIRLADRSAIREAVP